MMPSKFFSAVNKASQLFFMKAQYMFYTQNSRYDEINSTQQQLNEAQVG